MGIYGNILSVFMHCENSQHVRAAWDHSGSTYARVSEPSSLEPQDSEEMPRGLALGMREEGGESHDGETEEGVLRQQWLWASFMY